MRSNRNKQPPFLEVLLGGFRFSPSPCHTGPRASLFPNPPLPPLWRGEHALTTTDTGRILSDWGRAISRFRPRAFVPHFLRINPSPHQAFLLPPRLPGNLLRGKEPFPRKSIYTPEACPFVARTAQFVALVPHLLVRLPLIVVCKRASSARPVFPPEDPSLKIPPSPLYSSCSPPLSFLPLRKTQIDALLNPPFVLETNTSSPVPGHLLIRSNSTVSTTTGQRNPLGVGTALRFPLHNHQTYVIRVHSSHRTL